MSNTDEKTEAPIDLEMLRGMQESLLERCKIELQTVLDKYGCTMIAIPTVVPDSSGAFKLAARIQIVIKQGS